MREGDGRVVRAGQAQPIGGARGRTRWQFSVGGKLHFKIFALDALLSAAAGEDPDAPFARRDLGLAVAAAAGVSRDRAAPALLARTGPVPRGAPVRRRGRAPVSVAQGAECVEDDADVDRLLEEGSAHRRQVAEGGDRHSGE